MLESSGLTRVDSRESAAPGGGRLDKNADNSSTDSRRRALRASRWAAREAVQRLTHRPNVTKCGRCRIAPQVQLVVSPEGTGAFRGVATCGAVWLCAVCNAKIAARRALEVAAALQWAQETGSAALFGALTIRHQRDEPLDELLRILRRAWQLMTSGREWERLKESAGGEVMVVRTLEVNIGPNGWHPHLHPLFLLPRASRPEAERVAGEIQVRWLRSVIAAGGDLTWEAQKLEPVITLGDVGAYITDQTYGGKSSRLDLEMTNAQGKAGFMREKGTRSHWAVIADLASRSADNAQSEARYYQLEAYLRNVRQITWSPSLRTAAGIRIQSDERVAARVEGIDFATLTAAGWDELARRRLSLPTLEALDRGGWPAVAEVWDQAGIEYREESA